MSGLITFAGLDGAGKTTQAKLLAQWLQDLGSTVALEAPQGPSFVSKLLEDLTQILHLDDLSEKIDDNAVCLLRAVLRYRDWSQSVFPALQNVQFGITDRYVSCYYASIRARNAGVEEVLRTIFRDLPRPALALFIDVPPAVAYERIQRRGVDLEKIDFLSAYERAYKSLPEFSEFTVIDGEGSVDAVRDRIRAVVRARFATELPLEENMLVGTSTIGG